MVESEPVDELERLRGQASAQKAKAEALARAYNRSTWIRFVLVFFPVPLVVLLVRLYLEAWGYYLAGGLFIASAALLFSVDSAASARCDAAAQAADDAQKAYDDARLGTIPALDRTDIGP